MAQAVFTAPQQGEKHLPWCHPLWAEIMEFSEIHKACASSSTIAPGIRSPVSVHAKVKCICWQLLGEEEVRVTKTSYSQIWRHASV